MSREPIMLPVFGINRASDRVRPKMGIVRHYEGQLCGKKCQLYGKLCGSQLLISNVLGGAK